MRDHAATDVTSVDRVDCVAAQTVAALQQWWVLTVRAIVPTLRNGEWATAVAASVIFTAGFYIPLKDFMGAATHGISSSYGQYLTPLMALQAIKFASFPERSERQPTSLRASIDDLDPCRSPLTPAAARMSANMYRCVISSTIALICGYTIGFRFHRGGPFYIVGFCLLVLLIGARCPSPSDLIGTR